MSKSMTNNSWVSNSMGNWVSNMCHWVSNCVSNRVCNNSRVSNSVDNWVSNDSRVGNCMCNWMSSYSSILSFSIISNISNITIIVIGMILDMLDATIRKVDRVRSINYTSSIIRFSLVEGSTRVVISNSISVTVGGGLSKVRLGITSGMSNYWSMVDNRSMSNSYWVGNSMSHRVGNSYGVSNGMS